MAGIPQEIIDLYDAFTHRQEMPGGRPMGRRDFFERLTVLAGGTAAASALMPLLQNNYALAAVVPESDSRVATENVTFSTPNGPLKAYVAKPSSAPGRLPAVVVIHENRGVNPHIKDVARRIALDGFVAVAPDLLSAGGGATPAEEDRAAEMTSALDPKKTVQNLVAAAEYARSGRPDVTGKVGVVGFCWGGGMANQLAVHDPKLNAGVAYYGMQPSAADAARIKAPLLLHYAGLDQRTNAGIPAFENALKSAHVQYQVDVYEGANHAFNNDTNAARYNEQAARLAWGRTVTFLKKNLT